MIDAYIRANVDQGIIPDALPLEDIFAGSTLDT